MRRNASTLRSRRNVATSLPFAVHQPLHWAWPAANASTSLVNCPCRKERASSPVTAMSALLERSVAKADGKEEAKIKLVVVVENNSRGDVVNLGQSGSPPAINKRKADTLVLLNEGERLVIGGVTQTITQNTVRKVPFLGDIPFLGWLFKQKESFEQGRELVVFITPSVLKGVRNQVMTPAPSKE